MKNQYRDTPPAISPVIVNYFFSLKAGNFSGVPVILLINFNFQFFDKDIS